MKKLLTLTIMLLLLLPFSSITQASEVILNPEQPGPEDQITFTITPDTNQTIENLYLRIQECNGNTGSCYGFENLTTTQTDSVYTVTTTLAHTDATYITYQVIIHTSSGWIKETAIELDLNLHTGDTNDNTSTGNENDGPLIYFIAAIAAVLIIGSLLIVMVLRKKQ